MAFRNLRYPALALLVLALTLLLYGYRKPVTLILNGESRELTTSAWSIGELLQNEVKGVMEGDEVSPGLENRIWGNETIILDRAAWVFIRADGNVRSFRSTQRIPADLLALAGTSLSPGDQVVWQGQVIELEKPLPFGPTLVLEVRRTAQVQVQQGTQEQSFSSLAPTLGQALWEQGLRVRAGDRLDTGLEKPLAKSMDEIHKVRLNRGRSVSIRIAGETSRVYTSAETVGEALAAGGFALQGLDYSLPAEDDPLPAGQIRIVRVQEEVLIEQAPLPFESEYQPVEDLELDKKQVLETGEYGLSARRVRVVYEDGQEVNRVVEDEWIARPPKNRIVGYGTKLVMHTLETPDGVIQYWRALPMWATSYHPATTSNTTASGLPLRKGVAAIDRRYIPFHTRMYVPGYGEAVAADVGGGVYGRMIDLGYSDADYVSWHQWVTVYFLWPPPENIVWMIP